MHIPVKNFSRLDLQSLCRNWKQDADGVQRRFGCKAEALQILADSINSLLAKHPRTIFSQAWPEANQDSNALNPSIRFDYPDMVRNARMHRYSFVFKPYGASGKYGSVGRYPNQDFNTANVQFGPQTFSQWSDLYCHEFVANRDNRESQYTDMEYGVRTYNEPTILAMSVIEDPLVDLDTSIHTYCSTNDAKTGTKVLADALEDIRSEFHKIRSENLPVVAQWSAFGTASVTAPPGDQYGITVNSTSYVNIFDNSETARTANSPGFIIDMQYAGRGPEWSASGGKVLIDGIIRAKMNSGAGAIKIIGPDGIANNFSENTAVTSTLTSLSFSLYSDTTVDNTTFSTSMNKFDILAKVDSTKTMSIYYIGLYVRYEPNVMNQP